MTYKHYLYSNDLSLDSKVLCTGEDSYGFWIRMDRTIFHPQGGGQLSDEGTIGGIKVESVKHSDDGNINHYINKKCINFDLFEKEVSLSVDANARVLHSSLHTAGHLISAIIEKSFESLIAIKGHHWPNESRVEFECNGDRYDISIIKETLNNSLKVYTDKNHKVSISIEPDGMRMVTIGDLKSVPCGGTHVHSLGAIPNIFTKKIQYKKGNLKISYGLN